MKAQVSPVVPKPDKFPMVVKHGSASVKIYRAPLSVNGTRYEQFQVSYYLGNRRIRKRFSDLAKAKTEAHAAVVKLANADHEALKLSAGDRAAYVEAMDLLREFARPLNLAVAEYIEALRLLPAGVTLKEAVADYSRRRAAVREDVSVPDLVTQFIAAKAKAGMSERHLKDLRFRLGRFAKSCSGPVSSVSAPTIETYLDRLGVGARSRTNEITTLSALLRFAVRQRLASKDLLDELAAIERPKVEPPPTLIWTPEEYRELLESAPSELLAFIVFGGFCGMRTSEIFRCKWTDIAADGNHLAVITRKGRTPSRRLVPLCESAKVWLRPVRRESGPVCPIDREDILVRRITAAVNAKRSANGISERFQWRQNALRHSFGTYKTAASGDISRTALEMGNSPSMIVRHYLQLATKERAEQFFEILPSQGSNVIPFQSVAA